MGRRAWILGLVLVALSDVAWAQDAPVLVPFDSEAWTVVQGRMTEWEGRPCFQGTAVLEDVDLLDGVIEVDVALEGGRSYPGLLFRMQSETDYERFYIRPHKTGLYPDALQYTPVFNRVAGWQLYSGAGYTAGTPDRLAGWVRVRLEVEGERSRVFLDDATEPGLVIPRLEHGRSRGGLGVMGPVDGSACFADFRYRLVETPASGVADVGSASSASAPADPPAPPSGSIVRWEISRALKTDQLDASQYPRFYALFAAQWEMVDAREGGLVDVSRYRARSAGGPDLVMARTLIESHRVQDVTLSFGYSDQVHLYFNGARTFSGNSAYRSRDPGFAGIVGYHDAVHLTLRPGLNELLLMVTESFGGWGFMARLDDGNVTAPTINHDLTSLVWQTPDSLLTPESVIHDPDRDLLYVSSFDAGYQRTPEATGYISRVQPDGRILDQYWVTGLDAPTGMGLDGDRLWVLERRSLTEIHAGRGEVLNRYEISGVGFLNDLAVGPDGSVYISDTSPDSWRDSRIYRFKDGETSVWLDGDEINRANGLYVHGGELLVGNSGDGTLKAVDLEHRTVRHIVTLGAGIIDGIRVDTDGSYLVSLWEGALYRIVPNGRIVEVFHGRPFGHNSADFEFLPRERLLVIPTFLGNRVVARRLEG